MSAEGMRRAGGRILSTPVLHRGFPVGPCTVSVTASFLLGRWPAIDFEWAPGPRMWPLPQAEQDAFRDGVARSIASILAELNWMPDPPEEP